MTGVMEALTRVAPSVAPIPTVRPDFFTLNSNSILLLHFFVV